MSLPYFFIDQILGGTDLVILEEETSRHIAQVLRMQVNERLQLTDGKGNLCMAEIAQVHKKATGVKIITRDYFPPPPVKIAIGISLLKNAARFEWFLEKSTEIGVSEIIPLICDRTEKHHFRLDRMKSILMSAMLQSQQCWLPVLSPPRSLSASFAEFDYAQKFIAHCAENEKHPVKDVFNNDKNAIILVGPEGDFSKVEIEQALQHNFAPVTLGETRLRTETAGIVAVCLLKNLY